MKDPIKKAKNGTYFFRANIGYDIYGKKIQKYQSGFLTKKEAKKAYLNLINMKPDDAINEKSISFCKYTNGIFIPWYKTQVKESTFDNRLSLIQKHFTYFNRFQIHDITPLIIQKWQLSLAKKGFANNYIRSIQGLLSIAFKRAMILNLIKQNPVDSVGSVKKQKSKINFWTKDEFETVISFLYTKDFYQHYNFITLWVLFMTGLRIGEAGALQWKDIDFENQSLSVTKSLYYKNINNHKFVDTKNTASIRTIILDSSTIAHLQEWKNRQQNLIKTNFVLSYSGYPTPRGSVSRVIKRYANMAQVHYINVHALRHSHASLLIHLGVNPLSIKERLGHEDIQTTLETYGHLYPNANYVVAEQLANIVKSDTAKINFDTSPTNQYTIGFSKNTL